MWRALFNAIDLNGDNVIDFEEFLTFVTQLKRGDTEARRQLCFRIFDPNRDGYAEKGDFRSIAEVRASSLRRPSWQHPPTSTKNEDDLEEEYLQFFSECDSMSNGRISFEDFEKYCSVQGEAVVNQTLKLLELMFDGVIEETGIVITATDVKNTKPHIDWQDQMFGMRNFFCCSSQPPVFTTAPTA